MSIFKFWVALIIVVSYCSANSRFDFTKAVETKLFAKAGTTKDRFGVSVSIGARYAVVGASAASPTSTINSGASFIFTNFSRNVSVLSATATELFPIVSDPVPGESFGGSVALWGEILAVGTAQTDLLPGAVYIFMLSNDGQYVWNNIQAVVADDGVSGDGFGCSVAVSDLFLIVGASERNDLRGAAYVFAHMSDKWRQKAALVPRDSHDHQKFGYSVSLADNFAIIGAIGDKSVGPFAHGAAYIFVRRSYHSVAGIISWNWTEVGKVYAETITNLGNFGVSVSIARHTNFLSSSSVYTAVVGSDNDDAGGVLSAGSVHVYVIKHGNLNKVTVHFFI